VAKLIIVGGTVVDGTGGPSFPADLVIDGDRIVDIIRRPEASTKEINPAATAGGPTFDGFTFARRDEYQLLEATGLVVAPGFIDAHSHSDLSLLQNPRAESKIRQGVTTEVIGQCGSSAAPLYGGAAKERSEFLGRTGGLQINWSSLGDYLTEVEKKGVAVNVAPMVGHGNLRASVLGWEPRAATPAELEEMKNLLRRSLEEGALGLTTGLIYPPGSYAPTEEIIALAEVVAAYGGIYGSHIRGESDNLLEAVKEGIRIGREAGIFVEISHHKAAGRRNWGKTTVTLEMMETARREGVAVGCDVYPYTAASTSLSSLVPNWAQAGGKGAFLARLRDPAIRARLKEEIQKGIPGWENFIAAAGFENILITRTNRPESDLPGKTLAEIARERQADPTEVVFDLLIEEEANIGMVLFFMQEEDVRRVLRYSEAVIGSDASAAAPYGWLGQGKPHPRAYGTFARVLGHYVRQEGWLTLEEAVRKMTGQTAARYGLKGRGLIARGYYADLVIFDPAAIADRATYQEPHQYADGIHYVIVNGTISVAKGEHTGALAGRVLRRGQ